MRKGYLYSLIPLALLAADSLFFPVLWENRVVTERVDVRGLIEGKIYSVGRYRQHPLTLSAGRIEDRKYSERLGKIDAIAITVYSESPDNSLGIGGHGHALMSVLDKNDASALTELLDHTKSLAPGRIQSYPLDSQVTAGPLRDLRLILILRAVPGDDSAAKDALRTGLPELLDEAQKKNVSHLLLPTLTVFPSAGTPTFDDFFGYLFDALAQKPDRTAIDLTLWDQLPTREFEDAVASFNAHWQRSREAAPGYLSNIYRFQIRLILIGLIVGLLSSARRIDLSPRSVLIIGSSLALYLLGTFKAVEALAVGFEAEIQHVVMVLLTIVLAALYPQAIKWSAHDLFEEKKRAAH
jgi:hypothetical protein